MTVRLVGAVCALLLATAAPLFAQVPLEPRPACPADNLPALRQIETVPTACRTEPDRCTDRCSDEEPGYCLAAGYAAQGNGDDATAADYYERACRAGLANGCTNLGATRWSTSTSADDIDCAASLFSAACRSDEHFACGMLGRLDFANARTDKDLAAVRTKLDTLCDEVGGFSCRILAWYLERGELGDYEPARIATAARACLRRWR